MGLSAEEVALARRLGFQGYLDYHLDPYGIPDDAAGQFVATNYPALSQSGDALFSLAANTVTANLQEATLYQSAFSKRQLYERMVEFWSDHFNISITKVGYLKLLDDREVIRKHALGRFPAMLRASSRSAAMLVYLDQQLSRGTNPNQNYAREIMELHTLGVDGGYTQQDVAELSRILTGWSIEGRGRFAFNASVHDFGRKTFLGVDFPATPTSTGGNAIAEGQRAIGMLLAHPSTATFISTKLLRWLLSYEPTPAQVQAVAAVYTRTGGDVPSLVRAILTPDNLMAAPPKYKRPYHFVVSALRASGAAANTMAGVATMNRTVNALGQQLFVWDFPDGYPDQVEYWAGNIMPRWNAAITIANAASADLMVSVTPFQGATAAAVADNIDRLVFGGEMPAVLRTQLVTFLTPAPTSTTRVREALSLALSSSAFQWY
jgi:uncharacterized protein (DUF1800 family)